MATCSMCQGRFDGATFCPQDGTRLESEAGTDQLLGGRYRLIRRVGEGAMGVVFEAEHVHIHRRVAVKLLQRRLATNTEAVERMRREAQAMSGVGHPNIVDCSDFGIAEDGQVYLVMEWLEGENLDERLSRGPVDIVTALDIASQTCAGLAEAHAQGVIHRDLKPANLFLCLDRVGALRVKVLDFGIAKLGAEHAQLTSTGVVIGTPNYMAPEQALGDKIDIRADIYALGVILYEMLVGAVPFQADTPLAVLHQHTARMPALPSSEAPGRGISPELDAITMSCLAKAPEDRYQSAADLGAALKEVRGIDESRAVHSPAAPSAVLRDRSSGDSREDLVVLRRSGRTRRIVIGSVAAVLMAATTMVLVLHAGNSSDRPVPADAMLIVTDADSSTAAASDAVFSADAELPFRDARVPALDAAIMVAAADAPSSPTRSPRGTIRRVERGFVLEANVEPADPAAGQPTTLVIVIVPSSLNAAQRVALDDGQGQVQVSIEHFMRHDNVHRSTVVLDPDGSARIDFVPRAGKHHVNVEPSFEGRNLGRTRFDFNAR